ncbi:hypothetical protein [Allomuricauda sp. NBRC 101325]|uniref:hypothetical protein n=1 Tax=Allomuricauda sp. NBRC 101325 TaxID=1113758 RepID=UPI0024A16EEC|nr:hypothetical protein [Muricauda sp. NBRC 101325]GLU44754.1 hypothetical protein Musp01_23780 [Muricauda sp. NBRC 101325]
MKTVFILGAGFSKPAGAPVQFELMEDIINLRNQDFDRQDTIVEKLNRFEEFLENQLYISRQNFYQVTLEDIFTPLDRCIIDNVAYRGILPKDLKSLREDIYNLIVVALKERLDRHNNKGYIDDFAKIIVAEAKKRVENIKRDTISILSTNWDILLDNSLNDAIRNVYYKNNDIDGVVDYCCHVSSYDEDDVKIKPGLQALGEGKYNVKLLKLHGSMNWLQCTNCQRLYIKFNNKLVDYRRFGNSKCRHCNKNYKGNDTSYSLESNLIMPTFLKDLNNFQVKLIWQNAGVELSEANKIVFIGYSLPYADFELRQLLSRMVRHDAKIEVVLRAKENLENDPTYKRYKDFFGKRDIVPIGNGVEHYIETMTI